MDFEQDLKRIAGKNNRKEKSIIGASLLEE